MRFTKEMDDLKKSPKYPAARQLLDDILVKRQPSHETLSSLYSENVVRGMNNLIHIFYSNPRFVPGKIREHDTTAPTFLSDARNRVDEDPDFGDMESYLALQTERTESIDVLAKEIQSKIGVNVRNKFGQYSDYVIQELAMVMHHKLKRKCNISMASHWLGTSSLMDFLQKDNIIPTYPKDPYFRIMVAFLHDFKEDLVRKVLDKTGKPYGLYRAEEFGQDYLPPEKNLARNANILTNLYTEIPKFAYDSLHDKGLVFTQDTFKTFLTAYMDTDNNVHSSMYKIHNNLLTVMSKKDYSRMSGGDLLDAISWDTYEFYVSRIWSKSIKFEDDTPIITKFCDQSYNFMGKDILSDKDLTQNLLKLWLYGSEVYSSAINRPHTDAFVREVLEDALCYAEYYILQGFTKTEANVLFNASKFQKIIELSPIFYTDKKLNSIYELTK